MPREERLSARPIKRIAFDGRVGWLYLWNNGETQMLWLDRLSHDAVAAPVATSRKLRGSVARKDCNQTE